MLDIPTDTVSLSEQQRLVRDSIRDICADFDATYWRQRDRNGEYPHEFVAELVDGGWFGIRIPQEYGGVGMGTPETVVMFEEIAANGGGFSAAQAVHGGIYNSRPIVEYGSETLKAELLPEVAAGETAIQAFGLTEPNAGSDSTAIETLAERDGDEYVVSGQKIWTSRVDVSDYLLLMARTSARADVEKRTDGISMFLVDIDAARRAGQLQMETIPKTASESVHAFELWFDDLRVAERYLVGEEGRGRTDTDGYNSWA
ncbi:MAG: acyl-CoA dehydrogenase family protein [Haloarculaceae archaeon]